MTLSIFDSALTSEEILVQNPHFPAPNEILQRQRIVEVMYFGFDAKIHHGQIVIHEAATDDVKGFFELAHSIEFPIEKVIPICAYMWSDEKSCDDNNSAGYNYRTIHGTDKLSCHAYGLAFDINPVQNIYIKYNGIGDEIFRAPANGIYNEYEKGTLTKDHPLVQFLKVRGWGWGGDWTPETGRIDYQHFEKHI
jgi:hypothetical protein